jgi:hypothetical protein
MSLSNRNCANCACSFIEKSKIDKDENQMFCRRNPPVAAQMRGERPRLINGEMSIDRKTGKPVMENVQTLVYLYAPVEAALICFDGWRPITTLPGPTFQEWLPADKEGGKVHTNE